MTRINWEAAWGVAVVWAEEGRRTQGERGQGAGRSRPATDSHLTEAGQKQGHTNDGAEQARFKRAGRENSL